MDSRMFLLLWLVPLSLAKCPIGSTQGPGSTQCFIYRPKTSIWVTAEEDCVSRKGHLASVHDDLTNSFLSKFVSDYDANSLWLGGDYDLYVQNVWSWTDGTR